jgi:hypothetical protein
MLLHPSFDLRPLRATGSLAWTEGVRRLRPLAPLATNHRWAAGSIGAGVIALSLLRAASPYGDATGGEMSLRSPARLAAFGFEPNQGQTDDRVHFLSGRDGFAVLLAPAEMLLALPASGGQRAQSPIRMRAVGGDLGAALKARDLLPQITRHQTGLRESARNVPTYGLVEYQGLYPGIDLRVLGYGRELQYSFYVDRGASPRDIELAFSGVDRLDCDDTGLQFRAGDARLVQLPPVAYQIDGDRHLPVAVSLDLREGRRLAFVLDTYDVRHPLVIESILRRVDAPATTH